MNGEGTSIRKFSRLRPPTKISNQMNLLLEEILDQAPSSCGVSWQVAPTIENFIVGDHVLVGGNKTGVIAFIGETQFGPGDWAGVVLDEPIGKNDGAVAGVRYFQCSPNRGIFTRISRLSRDSGNTMCNSSLSPLQSSYNNTSATIPEIKRTLSSVSFGSSVASSRLSRTPTNAGNPDRQSKSNLKVGDRVIVQSSQGSKVGFLRYYGSTNFGNGVWCGVELDDPFGKNDGSVGDIRYFECAPKHGLFVPAEKVSRSPRLNKQSSVIGTIKRQGTFDSIRTTSTLQTSATSNFKTDSNSTSINTPVRGKVSSYAPGSALSKSQEQLNEREIYIQQLLKERELERAQIITAATQAENAETELKDMKNKYEQILIKNEINQTNYLRTIEKLEKEKHDLLQQIEEIKKGMEDLQFSYEEESITKSEIQALNEEYVKKLKNLEKTMNSPDNFLLLDEKFSSISETSIKKDCTLTERLMKPDIKNEKCTQLQQYIADLTQKYIEFAQECQQLRDSLKKVQSSGDGKVEVIDKLHEKIVGHHQLFKKIVSQDANVGVDLSEFKDGNILLGTGENDSVKVKDILNLVRDIAQQSSIKQKEFNMLGQCISHLFDEIEERNVAVKKVLLDNEETSDYVGRAITSLTNVGTKRMDVGSLLENCSTQLKEKLLLLLEHIGQLTDNEIAVLMKLEILTDVIVQKDALIEETMKGKQITDKELEDVKQKGEELEVIKCKFANLEKEKEDIEILLKVSEEEVTKLKIYVTEIEALKSYLDNAHLNLAKKCDECKQLSKELSTSKKQLDEHVEASKEKQKTFQKEKQELEASVTYLKEKLKTLDKRYHIQNEEQKVLEKKLEEANDRIKILELNLINAGSEVKYLREDLAKISSVEEQYQELRNKYKNLKETNKKIKESSEKEKLKLESSIVDLNKELKTIEVQKQYEVLKETNEKNKEISHKEIHELKANVSQLTENLSAATNDVENARISRKEGEMLEKEIREANVKIKLHETCLANNENELQSLREKLAAISTMQVQYQELHKQLENFKEANRKIKETFQEEKKKLETNVNHLNKKLTAMTDEAEQGRVLIVEKEVFEKEIQEANAKIRMQGTNLAGYGTKLQSIHNKLAAGSTVESQYQELLKQNEDFKKTSKEIQENLMRDKKELETNVTYLNEKLIAMTNEVEKEESQRETEEVLKKQMLAANNKIKLQETNLAKNESELRSLRDNLLTVSSVNSQFQELRKQYEDLKVSLRSTLDMKNKLQTELESIRAENQHLLNSHNEWAKNIDVLPVQEMGIEISERDSEISRLPMNLQRNKADSNSADELNIKNSKDMNNKSEDVDNNEHIGDEGFKKKCIQEKTEAENQIEFLNSVIVDIQHKNDVFLERITYLESIIPHDLLKPKKTIAPRMFCDICDVFDAHETEDCAKQGNSSPPIRKKSDVFKTKLAQRPYCDICEVFGHDRSECKDDETF